MYTKRNDNITDIGFQGRGMLQTAANLHLWRPAEQDWY